jgi:hypothetical protein
MDGDDLFIESSSDESDLCLAYEWITLYVDDYVSENVYTTCLEEVDPESDVQTLTERLQIEYSAQPDPRELPRKNHFSLLFIDKNERSQILKKNDVLSRLRISHNSKLFYINTARISVGRDYWAPPDPNCRPLHYRSSKAWVKQVLGQERWGLDEGDLKLLYSLYMQLDKILKCHINLDEISHRHQIDYLKKAQWTVRPEHVAAVDAAGNIL